MNELLGIIGVLVLMLEIYRWLRWKWIQHMLEGKKKAKMPRKPVVMRPKSELDCQQCVKEKGKKANPEQKRR